MDNQLIEVFYRVKQRPCVCVCVRTQLLLTVVGGLTLVVQINGIITYQRVHTASITGHIILSAQSTLTHDFGCHCHCHWKTIHFGSRYFRLCFMLCTLSSTEISSDLTQSPTRHCAQWPSTTITIHSLVHY